MKINALLVSILAVFALVVSTGCQSMKKSNPAQSAPPVSTTSTPAAGGNSNPSGPASAVSTNQRPPVSPATMQASAAYARPGRVLYTAQKNLIDPWQNPVSDAVLWVVNDGSTLGYIRIGQSAVGMPDGNGGNVLVVLPPGEKYGIPDYKPRPQGYAAETIVDFVFIDGKGNGTGYVWTSPEWPPLGFEWGKEMYWSVVNGTPKAATTRVVPIKIHQVPGTHQNVQVLSSQGAAALQQIAQILATPPAGSAPASAAGNPTTSSQPPTPGNSGP